MIERLTKVQNRKPHYKPIEETGNMLRDYHKFSVKCKEIQRMRQIGEIRAENSRLAHRIHSQ